MISTYTVAPFRPLPTERVVRQLWTRPAGAPVARTGYAPAADVYREDDDLVARFDLPGVDPEPEPEPEPEPTGTPTPEPEHPTECDAGGLTAWSATAVFVGGDRVLHGGSLWRARWWTRGEAPSYAAWGPWQHVALC